MIVAGIILRLPIADYAGATDQASFNYYLFSHFGSYSDVASLYFRDQLWMNPVPYIDYPLEYPVGTGMLIWLTGIFASDVWSHYLINAIVLVAAAGALVYIVIRVAPNKAWLLVLPPALALYVTLNWDIVSIVFLVGSILMFDKDRDIGGSILLTLAIWTKFFPIVVVPLVLAYRWKKRAFWRICAVIAAGSLLMNGFFALQVDGTDVSVREGWKHFFIFNRDRPVEVNLWSLFDDSRFTTSDVNMMSGVLTLLSIAVLALLVYRNRHLPLLPILSVASLASLASLFFFSKVYSPQYGLWIVALLPLAAAPVMLGAYFGAVDAFYFATSFIALQMGSDWFYNQVLIPSMVVREAVLFALVAWAAVTLYRSARSGSGLSRAAVQVE